MQATARQQRQPAGGGAEGRIGPIMQATSAAATAAVLSPARPTAELRGTLLLRDCLEAQGAFLLVQLIKSALTDAAAEPIVPPPAARRVVLVAAQHAASHYVIVLRKAGLHMPDLLASGRLAVVDLLPLLGARLPPLQALQQQLAAAASGSVVGSGTGGGVCLVVDDLAALHCLAHGEQDWAAFLHCCTSLGQAPQCCFIGLAHADIEGDEGWLARLEHCAALVLDTEPLEPGRPASNTGRLAITRRDVPAGGGAASSGTSAFAPGCRVLGYRLSETGPAFLHQEQHGHPHIL